jgi:hypothetical protein
MKVDARLMSITLGNRFENGYLIGLKLTGPRQAECEAEIAKPFIFRIKMSAASTLGSNLDLWRELPYQDDHRRCNQDLLNPQSSGSAQTTS